MKLVKLHGSLNWHKIDDGRIVKSEKTRMSIGGKSVKGQAMLYPIQQKDLYLEPWFDLFRGFKKDLFQTRIWIVIGYSFHDQFVREIFNEALTSDRKLIIVNPSAKSIKKDLFNFDNVSTIPYEFHENNTRKLIAEELK